jgi:hypothetical protein
MILFLIFTLELLLGPDHDLKTSSAILICRSFFKSHKIDFSATSNPSLLLLIVTFFLRLELARSSSPKSAVSLAWAEGPTKLLIDSSKSTTTRVTLVSRGNSASVEFQGQEVLSLRDTPMLQHL